MTLISACIGDRRGRALPAPQAFGAPGAAADVDFLLRGRAGDAPQCVLAVPCGGGEHALSLAQLGHHVTAIDPSPALTAAAEATACAERLPLRFAAGDIESLVPGELFDGVICLGGAIDRLDAKASALFLNLAAAALRPHGWIALDSLSCAESVFPPRMRFRAGIVRDRLQSTLSPGFSGGYGKASATPCRVTTSGELVRLLASVGFRVTGLHAGADGAAFVPGAERLLVTATRVY